MDRKIKVRSVFKALKKTYPDAKIELDFSNPLELAVATILSAQCTDVKVNQVTPALFRRCKTILDYTKIPQEELEAIIRPTGFYRQKGKNIKKMAEIVMVEHGGKMPQTIEELVQLPGIGRKTANVILGNAFGIPGFPVDTHVIRLSGRIGLTAQTDPVKIEHDLCPLLPKAYWTLFSHLLIWHGRRTCVARKPNCPACNIRSVCNYYAETGKLAEGRLEKAAPRTTRSTVRKKKDGPRKSA